MDLSLSFLHQVTLITEMVCRTYFIM